MSCALLWDHLIRRGGVKRKGKSECGMNQHDCGMSESHGGLKLIESGLKRGCSWGTCSECSISDASKQGTFMVLRSTGGERSTGK